MDLQTILFVDRWPFWAAGLAIGLFTVALHAGLSRPLGVSTGLSDACSVVTGSGAPDRFRLLFILGIPFGGLAALLASGAPLAPRLEMGLLDTLGLGLSGNALLLAGGGLALGFGARLAGGCTSGHGILGMSLLAPSSLAATATFMATGALVANLLFR